MSTAASAAPAHPTDPPRGTVDRLVDATAGRLAGPAFALGSLVRRARVFHPRGRTFTAHVQIRGDHRFAGTVLGRAATHDGVVRFSRGAGLPEPMPDLLGLALRLHLTGSGHGPEDAQDVLMISSWPAPVSRHVLVPSRDYGRTYYSTLTPFRVGGETVLLGARPDHLGETGPLERLDALEEAAAGDWVRFELVTATPLGPWTAVGTVVLGGPVPDDAGEALRYTPFHRAGGIEPVGVVNDLRRRAYADSQAARPS